MYPVLFRIGNFPVTSHGVFIVLSILAGAWFARRTLRRYGFDPELIWEFIPYAALGGVIGARLWEVVFAWEYYGQNPADIIKIWEGGASIQGGIVGGLIGGIWFVRSRKLDFWRLADLVAPGLILGQGIGRLTAEVLAGDAYGRPTGMEFGIVYPPGTPAYAAYGSVPLWPAEIFEGLWDLAVVWILLRLLARSRTPGAVFLAYVALYSLGRFYLEFLRGDSLMVFGMKAAQLTSLLAAVLALGLYLWRLLQTKPDSGGEVSG